MPSDNLKLVALRAKPWSEIISEDGLTFGRRTANELWGEAPGSEDDPRCGSISRAHFRLAAVGDGSALLTCLGQRVRVRNNGALNEPMVKVGKGDPPLKVVAGAAIDLTIKTLAAEVEETGAQLLARIPAHRWRSTLEDAELFFTLEVRRDDGTAVPETMARQGAAVAGREAISATTRSRDHADCDEADESLPPPAKRIASTTNACTAATSDACTATSNACTAATSNACTATSNACTAATSNACTAAMSGDAYDRAALIRRLEAALPAPERRMKEPSPSDVFAEHRVPPVQPGLLRVATFNALSDMPQYGAHRVWDVRRINVLRTLLALDADVVLLQVSPHLALLHTLSPKIGPKPPCGRMLCAHLQPRLSCVLPLLMRCRCC
jgi:hypothetical protein